MKESKFEISNIGIRKSEFVTKTQFLWLFSVFLSVCLYPINVKEILCTVEVEIFCSEKKGQNLLF